MIWGTEMASQQYRSQFGDTTLTKVFVGGLAWETPTEEMRRYFDQFGEILEAVIITDKATDKSKGYGFVTFRDPESARRACADPNPVIDGRRANCNIASFGRPRPSPPRGRNHGGQGHHGGGGQQAATSYGRILAPPPPPFIYPPYGYTAYPPEYGYHQAVYNNQFPSQYYYGTSSSSIGPYPYGHAGYPLPASGPTFSVSQRHRLQLPPYQYLAYPPPGEGSRTPPSPSPSQPYNFTSPTPIWLSFPPSDPQPHNEPSTAAAAETSATAKRSSS